MRKGRRRRLRIGKEYPSNVRYIKEKHEAEKARIKVWRAWENPPVRESVKPPAADFVGFQIPGPNWRIRTT